MCGSAKYVAYRTALSVQSTKHRMEIIVNTLDQPQPTRIGIRTVLTPTGDAYVALTLPANDNGGGNGDVHIALQIDACAELGLNLVSASYAARIEQTLFKYAQDNSLDLDDLISKLRATPS